MKNPIIIEFYGLPGSGKSTISHAVAERIRKRKKVLEPSFELDHNYSSYKRRVIKLCQFIVLLTFFYKKYKKLKSIISSNGNNRMDAFRHEVNVAYKILAYNKNADYLIFDEGLTQTAISIVKGEKSSIENEMELYSLCDPNNIIKIYVKISPKKALNRMLNRRNHDSRIESIKNKKKQLDELNDIEKQCALIEGMVINGELPIEQNIESILREIGEI